ncbi:MAG: hypothetical protein GY797_03490, partial [Deltaproteobacteria bacterium]|nr:hypothetical protein [Deltaproteobacteria bacterium]
EDQLRHLKFQFALYGINLSQRPVPQVSGGYAPPVAPVQVAVPASSPEPAAYVPAAEPVSDASTPAPAAGGKKEPSNVKQSMQKAGSAGTQAQGCMSSLAGILRILGRLLPGPLGQPFRKISQQMTAGQNVARHVTQKPGQVMRQTNQLRRHAAQITPTQSKTSATPSSTPAPATSNVAPAGVVDTVGPAVKSPPPQAIPSAPAAAPSGKQQKRRGKGYHTAANPAH